MAKRLEWRTGNGVHTAQADLWERYTRGGKPPRWSDLKTERSATLLSLYSYGFTLTYLYNLDYEREPNYIAETLDRCRYLLEARNGEWRPDSEARSVWDPAPVAVPDDNAAPVAGRRTQGGADEG